jgi:hypothetical protein
VIEHKFLIDIVDHRLILCFSSSLSVVISLLQPKGRLNGFLISEFIPYRVSGRERTGANGANRVEATRIW